jgi:hypothetical protein
VVKAEIEGPAQAGLAYVTATADAFGLVELLERRAGEAHREE